MSSTVHVPHAQCPACHLSSQVEYSVIKDECTCFACGLVAPTEEFVSKTDAERSLSDKLLQDYESFAMEKAASEGETLKQKYQREALMTHPVSHLETFNPIAEYAAICKHMNCSNFKLKSDWVVIKADKPEEVTSGGIIVPQSAQNIDNLVHLGTIVAAGPGDGDFPMTVKVGDRVIFTRSRSNRFEVDGYEYDISHEEQFVIAVIE